MTTLYSWWNRAPAFVLCQFDISFHCSYISITKFFEDGYPKQYFSLLWWLLSLNPQTTRLLLLLSDRLQFQTITECCLHDFVGRASKVTSFIKVTTSQFSRGKSHCCWKSPNLLLDVKRFSFLDRMTLGNQPVIFLDKTSTFFKCVVPTQSHPLSSPVLRITQPLLCLSNCWLKTGDQSAFDTRSNERSFGWFFHEMNSGLVAPCNLTVDLLSWRPQHLASCVRCVWFRCVKFEFCCVSHLVGSIICVSQFVIRLKHFKFGCNLFSTDFGPFIGAGFTVNYYQLDFARCILHIQYW